MASVFKNILRRLRYGQPIVVVSGLPRSGTSMTMKMLDAAGLGCISDGQRQADVDNPEGYFEDERVKELGQIEDTGWLRGARGRVIKIVSPLLQHLPPGNSYKVIFMRRDIEEILASQQKMLERRGEASDTEDDRMAQLFEADLFRARYLMKRASQFDFTEIHYRKTLEDPVAAAEQIRDFLGMNLDVDEMISVVDPELYRNRKEALSREAAGSA